MKIPSSQRLRCLITILLITMGGMIFFSCVTPSPLYGSWADNKGNTFSFFSDSTFTAKVSRLGRSENFEGTYTLLMNVITLDCTEIDLRIVTEWDIRGNILYLNWVSVDGETISMALFKVSN